MNVTLSSKGQLVIPRKIRQVLDLRAGAKFNIELVGEQIVLYPINSKTEMLRTIHQLHALAQGDDLLDLLAEERRQERERESRREQSLFAG